MAAMWVKTTGIYDKWANFFGLCIGYDKKEGAFDNTQLDGHVTGLLWSTQGDDVQRKYDYSYDHSGRLVNALFKERALKNDTWDNSKMDFSVTGSSGKIAYDYNGNITSMLQKGVLPGTATPVEIDKLAYTYTNATYNYGNKLFKVKDNTAQSTSTNGQSGDFKDGTNGTADDYAYDDNGNLILDNNKSISSITYNFLDKPELITITGKGTIKIVYDAEGNKLQKIFTPQSGAAVTTTYINAFVYKDDALQYINFEEGRIRVITPVSQDNGYDALLIDGNMTLQNGKEGVYDFFIRDYQENVRMIVTEEVHNGSNECTMETSRASVEEPLFGQNGSANEVVVTRSPKPTAWQSNTSSSVSKLGSITSGAPSKTGPNVLLKVMAGDIINATTDYYYKNTVTNGTGNNLTTDVLASLIQSILGSSATSGLVKGAANNISTQLSADPSFIDKTAPDANNINGTKPKAYITVLFFDERFNYVSTGSTYKRVSVRGDGAAPMALTGIQVPKNGYAFAYVSNESDEPVYFDNFTVGLNRGRIIEEDHYYAFGLKIAAISSQKLGDPNEGFLDNKNLYNDKELFDDADLDWYDYGFRNYDAQIGRFTQLDPLTWYYPELTPYQYAGNEPIANVDMDGLEPCPVNVAGDISKVASNFPSRAVLIGAGRIGTTVVKGKSTNPNFNPNNIPGLKGEPATQPKPGEPGIRPIVIPPPHPLVLIVIFTLIPDLDSWNRKSPREFPDSYYERNFKFKPAPEVKPEYVPSKPDDNDRGKEFYITYTKTKVNPDGSITVYSGRTSGTYQGAAPTREDADRAVAERDKGHHIKGYQGAVTDEFSINYLAIRGREQQLIDRWGGAKSDGGTSGNAIRGVGRWHPLRFLFDWFSTLLFGKLPNNNPTNK